ncbi:MAG: carbamoyl-phosphate synthase large subunit, partial [Deltaproteobacteria bacterium]|nr:carbamoyl-phosphate synthase large subunit [Deltaproteobacteria bacterium]
RDAKNQKITACFIENVDAAGVHTGDSCCVVPPLTVGSELQTRLEKISHQIIEALEVVGGANVKLAHQPQTGRVVVIGVNPRASRSSALASKATGLPLARVSALLTAGLTLDEIPCQRHGSLDKYTPSTSQVTVKLARWAFEEFSQVEDRLGLQMRAVGQVLGLGRTFKEALQKAVRSLEKKRFGLGFARDFDRQPLARLMRLLGHPSSERPFIIYEALRQGAEVEVLAQRTQIKPWFIQQIKELVDLEEKILAFKGQMPPDELLAEAKKDGFADCYLAQLLGLAEEDIRARRQELGLVKAWQPVPVSGLQEAASYYYSSHNAENQLEVSPGRKVLVLGSGPNRIGQGSEFDYCSVQAASALSQAGLESILVNSNPQAVSTDYDAAARLYFEPLTVEDVLSIYRQEKPEGVLVQFGGQTAVNLASQLAAAGVKILGTSFETTALVEDRDRFREVMRKLYIPLPDSELAATAEEAWAVARKIGYPFIVRSGQALDIIHDQAMFQDYLAAGTGVSPQRPLLIEKFLENAIEAEVNAISDGSEVFVPAVMERIELAGIHPSDSACVIPPVSISPKNIDTIEDYTKKIAVEFNIKGLLNIQFAIVSETVYIMEAKPRASRTVPLVGKVCNVPLARLATQVILGQKLKDLGLRRRPMTHFGVREAVFPFSMLPELDPVLGPKMRSTGEVLGLAESYGLALYKAQEAAQQSPPDQGAVLITVSDHDKSRAIEVARKFRELGFSIKATAGTYQYLTEQGIEAEEVLKISEGRPNIVDAIKNGEIQLLINTPGGRFSVIDDSPIRRAAVRYRVPYVTTTAAALSAARGIASRRWGEVGVKSLQSYYQKLG